jgi:hypothetical protein
MKPEGNDLQSVAAEAGGIDRGHEHSSHWSTAPKLTRYHDDNAGMLLKPKPVEEISTGYTLATSKGLAYLASTLSICSSAQST